MNQIKVQFRLPLLLSEVYLSTGPSIRVLIMLFADLEGELLIQKKQMTQFSDSLHINRIKSTAKNRFWKDFFVIISFILLALLLLIIFTLFLFLIFIYTYFFRKIIIETESSCDFRIIFSFMIIKLCQHVQQILVHHILLVFTYLPFFQPICFVVIIRKFLLKLIKSIIIQNLPQNIDRRFIQTNMKYTHHALTSIHVEKVQNITTSMTRAGLGDDTYRRQRQKQRYLKCKEQQIEKQEKMRQDFMQQRQQKIKQAESITEKKNLKRQKKKQLQKQRQIKMKLLKKLGDLSGSSSNQQELNHNQDHLKGNNQVSNPQKVGESQNDTEKALNQLENEVKDQNECE